MTQVYFTPHEIGMAAFYAERGKPFDAAALLAGTAEAIAREQDHADELRTLENECERYESECDDARTDLHNALDCIDSAIRALEDVPDDDETPAPDDVKRALRILEDAR